MKIRFPLLALAASACLVFGSLPATAGDHLKCYKVKDKVTGSPLKAKYTVDLPSNLSPLLDESGCTVAVPAKMCCAPVDKVPTAPSPPPPDGTPHPQPAAGKFCCYKVKCPKLPVPGTASFDDQFGIRTLTLSNASFLCAPASPSGAFLDSSDLF